MTYFVVLAATNLLTIGALIGLVVWLTRTHNSLVSEMRSEQAQAFREAQEDRDKARDALLVMAEHAETERQVLLDRIQRPEVAPVQYAPEPAGVPLFVDSDDDEGQWEILRNESQRKAAAEANGEG